MDLAELGRKAAIQTGRQLAEIIDAAISSGDYQSLNEELKKASTYKAEGSAYDKAWEKSSFGKKGAGPKSASGPEENASKTGWSGDPLASSEVKKAMRRGGSLFKRSFFYGGAVIFGILSLINGVLSGVFGGFTLPLIVTLILTVLLFREGRKEAKRAEAEDEQERREREFMADAERHAAERQRSQASADSYSARQNGPSGYEEAKDASRRAAENSQSAGRQAADRSTAGGQTAAAQAESRTKKHDPETEKMLEEGRRYIASIHHLNDVIDDEEMSRKLDRLELVVTKIFDQVDKDPKSAPDLRRLMQYYLPATEKLVKTYADLCSQEIETPNIAATKKQIEDSLDTVNGAFEKLLNEFFQDTAWDVSSDISVMETMFAQDGLTEDELAKARRRAQESLKSGGTEGTQSTAAQQGQSTAAQENRAGLQQGNAAAEQSTEAESGRKVTTVTHGGKAMQKLE